LENSPRCDGRARVPGSSRLDLGEWPLYPLPILLALLIGWRLRLGTGQRVQDAQPRQHHEIVEIVGDPPLWHV
jgi:hypothetical protein